MDSTLTLLKEEINKTNESEHDLAKWKLVVTAALGAAAFGLGKDHPSYWLLLFIPFVCAYIDLFEYQYEIRILVIARFLRTQGQQDAVLQAYEQECEQMRRSHVFSLGDLADFACSLGACIIGPVFYVLHRASNPNDPSLLVSHVAAAVIWSAGVFLVIALWIYFQIQRRQLSGAAPREGHKHLAHRVHV